MADDVLRRFLGLIEPIKENIRDIYLFGSRTRLDWRPDSDYDVLVLLERKEREIIDRLYDAVMDTLMETGQLISLKIFSRIEFERLQSMQTPFSIRIMKEAIKIG